MEPYSFRDGGNRFRFIGHDGSMGYRTGRVYHLGIIWHEPLPDKGYSTGLTIFRMGWQGFIHGKGYCPYSNQDKFFENWEIA